MLLVFVRGKRAQLQPCFLGAHEEWCSRLSEPLFCPVCSSCTLHIPWKGGAGPQPVLCVMQLCIIEVFELQTFALGIGSFVTVSRELKRA